MKQVQAVALISLLLVAIGGCEEHTITSQPPTDNASRVLVNAAPENGGGGNVKSGGQNLPTPTITKQTYIPAYEFFAEMKCHAWRITWPTYPAGTDPNLIPTVFTLSNGGLNSFQFLNNTSASTTYKTNFNLYNNAKVETANTLWSELKYAFDADEKMELTRFYKTNYSVQTIEYMVKERPQLFEIYGKNAPDPYTEFTYQQGDIFLYKLEQQNRYGGVRIVSMTPRIIEVYLPEANK